MKLRSDFVSNSSSCSFIVRDVHKAASVIAEDLAELFDDMPYDIWEIDVGISAKRKDMRSLYELFKREEYREPQPFYWNGEYENPDPEEDITEYGFSIDTILRSLADKSIVADPRFSLINSICLVADDYQSQLVTYLYLLYKYLKSRDVNVDDSESEHEMGDYDNRFIGTLMRKIYGKNS